MNLLFDLDGTLTDAASGITLCLQHALLRLGRQPPPVGYLRRFIGPPLRATFVQLLATDDSAVIESALAHYQLRIIEEHSRICGRTTLPCLAAGFAVGET